MRTRSVVAGVGAAVVAAALGACFYVDPINERPSADIFRVDPELPMRGDPIVVQPYIIDPDGDATEAYWRAYACDADGCDLGVWADATTYQFTFFAPYDRASGAPATRVRIELDVFDAYGARAVPLQRLDVNLGNDAPEFVLVDDTGRFFDGAYPVGTPVILHVTFDDPDDGADRVVVGEPTFNRIPDAAQLTDATIERIDSGATPGLARWRLVAQVAGTWSVMFSIADPLGETTTEPIPISYADDRPPCIGVADPVFPPVGARMIVDAPTRFGVVTVRDDLDAYPLDTSYPFLGLSSFRWYLADPSTGGVLRPLGIDGNAVEIDPRRYRPGDPLELRVEAVDQVDRPLCDSTLPTCEATTGCFQRRTWSLEVR
jgi:hypothetical protein